MLSTKKHALIFTLVGVLVVVTLVIQLHFVSDHAGATVFQKGNEAYLFVGGGHTGWHCPALAYPVILALGYFGAVTEPSDKVSLSLVIRVSPQGVQRWMNQGVDVGALTPFQDGFYARCPGTMLCKWTESGFVRASPEEEKRIEIDNLHRGSLDNKLINGWSTHALKVAPGDHFEVELGDNLAISVKNHSEIFGFPEVTIDLLRPGKAPENIYRADAKARLVSKTEYQQLLGKR
jgi:hypothetical protein